MDKAGEQRVGGFGREEDSAVDADPTAWGVPGNDVDSYSELRGAISTHPLTVVGY